MKAQALPEKVQVIIHRDTDGLFWTESPDVSYCYSQGRTIDEAIENMTDAILTHFEVDLEDQALKDIKPQAKLKAELRFS